jgi:hypothetical protein
MTVKPTALLRGWGRTSRAGRCLPVALLPVMVVTAIQCGAQTNGGTISGSPTAAGAGPTFITCPAVTAGEGDAMATIAACIAQAGAGGTVHLPAGTYTIPAVVTGPLSATFYLSSSVSLVGEGPGATVIRVTGTPTETTVLFNCAAAQVCRVANMTIAGPSSLNGFIYDAIEHRGETGGLTVENVAISQVTMGVNQQAGTADLTVLHCDITAATQGVYTAGSGHITVRDTRFHDIGTVKLHHGIYYSAAVASFEAKANTFQHIAGYGINSMGGGPATIENNGFTDCKMGAEYFGDSGGAVLLFEFNVVSGNGPVVASPGLSIIANQMYSDTPGSEIGIEYYTNKADGGMVAGNVFGGYAAAIQLDPTLTRADGMEFKGNTFTSDRIGVSASTLTNSTISNNVSLNGTFLYLKTAGVNHIKATGNDCSGRSSGDCILLDSTLPVPFDWTVENSRF